jgi:hypothetical protein
MGSNNRTTASDRGNAIADVPDVPTLGTVTVDGCSAYVPVTAAPTGGAPTLYTATSNPGSLTGTATSSPITVINLVPSTSYTFTVVPQSANGLNGTATSASNSITAGAASIYSYMPGSSTLLSGNVNTSNGDIYASGYYYGASPQRAIAAKYNSSGTEQWENTYTPSAGNPNIEWSDYNSGYIWLGGNITDTSDCFVTKINSSGTLQWAKKIGDGTNSQGYTKIFADSSENIYGIGYYYDSGTPTYFGILHKLNSNGGTSFQRRFGRTFSNTPTFIYDGATDGNDIYICGITSVSSSNWGIIVKANSSGNRTWVASLQGPSSSANIRFFAVNYDGSGNVYGAGHYNSSNFLTVKYDSSGTIQWQRILTKSGQTINGNECGVGTDSSGNVFSMWRVNPGSGYYYLLLAKYDSSGTLQWTKKISISDDEPRYPKLKIENDILYISFVKSANYSPIIFAVPASGNKTGTYTLGGITLTYENDSWSGSTSTYTTGTGGGEDFSATSWSNSAVTMTTTSSTFITSSGVVRF